MIIEIKSEMDSRPLLYPMIRCLLPYGRILVATDNKYVERLTSQSGDIGFDDVTVIYGPDSTFEDLTESYDIDVSAFDLVFCDNMPVTNPDKTIVLVNRHQSEDFLWELLEIMEIDLQVVIIGESFATKGKGAKGSKKERPVKKEKPAKKERSKKERKSKKKKPDEIDQGIAKEEQKHDITQKQDDLTNIEMEASEVEYDPVNKWRGGKSRREIVFDKLMSKDRFMLTPMNLIQVDKFESTLEISGLDRKILEQIYNIFKDEIKISKTNFLKEVSKPYVGSYNQN